MITVYSTKNAKATVFSSNRVYRYVLWREWNQLLSAPFRYAMFIGLNPSTADETKNDPTVRKCIGFAKRWGYDGLCMTNLFAFRATDPGAMLKDLAPIGPDNDDWLVKLRPGAATGNIFHAINAWCMRFWKRPVFTAWEKPRTVLRNIRSTCLTLPRCNRYER